MQELNYEETAKSFYELLRRIQRSYVKDTTKDRAPDFYQAPDFSSENPEKDFEEGKYIMENDLMNWRKGKLLLLKAAHNGHAKAQFLLGNIWHRSFWLFNADQDLNMAEIWLQKAVRNGLSGEDFIKAKSELYDVQSQRHARWMRPCFNEEEP